MIIIYHHTNKVSRIVGVANDTLAQVENWNIAQSMLMLAKELPKEKIVWCCEDFASKLNFEKIDLLCHHQKMMLSYSPEKTVFLQKQIGYIEQSPFLKVNKEVQYPTWLMSTNVGVIHASALAIFFDQIKPDSDFEYFLNSVAKLGMPKGLFCYSEPQLLFQKDRTESDKPSSYFTLFRFVKQHFKKRWLLLLFVNLIIFEKRFLLVPFFYSLFYKSRRETTVNFDSIPVQSILSASDEPTIDVIIPTIGRKKYLYDVLKDLANQSVLPINVIIVEQNPDLNSVSNLDYLTTESWPFSIKHTFTHQAGACNARNIALDLVESEWVFLADDDIVFESDFFDKGMALAKEYGATVFTASCLSVGQEQQYKIIHQSGIFGSGTSFVNASSLKNIRFDNALEFGYGEDTDFGLQLRNQGHDVIYFPTLKITHLKAPIGGFRTPIVKAWDSEKIQPKPSPTIMYVYIKHFTLEQLRGYQIILFFKLLKNESIRNYFGFYKEFKLKWKASLYWANQLPS